MSILPGWDSADTTAAIAHNLHITAIIVLGLLFLSEGLALIYDSRKEHLVGVAARIVAEQNKRDADATEARNHAAVDAVERQLAEAEKKVAVLDRLRAPRRLSDVEKAKLLQVLTGNPTGNLVIKAGSTVGDETSYAEEIAVVFRSAGWTVRIDSAIHIGSDTSGLWIKMRGTPGESAPPAVMVMFTALKEAGLPLRGEIAGESSLPADEIWLSIGNKK